MQNQILEATHAAKLEKDLLGLKKELLLEKYFRASALYYISIILIVLLIAAASIALLSTHSTWGFIGAVLLFTFYYPQLAFLGHDFGHSQVFRGRHARLNSLLGNYLFGGLLQGFSSSWWNRKHNSHHAKPNMYELRNDKPTALDDDIDTAPFIIWDLQLLTPERRQALRYWLPLQRYALILFLPLSRFSWASQSFWTSMQKRKWLECLTVVTHYMGFFYLLVSVAGLSFFQAFAFWLLTNATGGLMLSWIFILNHVGKDIYDSESDLGFFHSQLRSTRNITSGIWMNWLTGGLNLQLEHHLFPTLPRHQLAKIRSSVRRIVENNGFVYESVGFFAATRLIFHSLPRGHAAEISPNTHFVGHGLVLQEAVDEWFAGIQNLDF